MVTLSPWSLQKLIFFFHFRVWDKELLTRYQDLGSVLGSYVGNLGKSITHCFSVLSVRKWGVLIHLVTFKVAPNCKIMWLARRKDSLPYYNHWWESKSLRDYRTRCHLMTDLAAEGCIRLYSWWWTWGWYWVNEMGYSSTHSDPELKEKMERVGFGLLPDHVEE